MTHPDFDAWSLAAALGLDPYRSGEGEARIRCPNGCDASSRRGEYEATTRVAKDDRHGAWKCYKCEGAGHLLQLAESDGLDVAGVKRLELPPEPAPPKNPIDMARAWKGLLEVKPRFIGEIERYFLDRGWPLEIAELAAGLDDLAWAPHKPIGAKDADRLASHARWADRPLLFVVRDEEGNPRSAYRRTVTGEDPKAKACSRTHAPAERPHLYGHLRAWAQAAKEGQVVVLVEGEPDFALASALCKLEGSPIGAALGVPSAGHLPKAAEAAARALSGVGAIAPRVVVIPHLGDTGKTEAAMDKGLKMMTSAAWVLRKRARALVSTLHVRPLASGKGDLSDVLERRDLDAVLEQLAEVAPLRLGPEDHSWDYADELVHSTPSGESRVATSCWPVSLTWTVETGQYGLRYRYVTRDGAVRHGHTSASAWMDRSASQTAGREAADAGVQVHTNKGSDFVEALGRWADWHPSPPQRALSIRPGWHLGDGQVYVNGDAVHGAPWFYGGPDFRSKRKGTLEGWQEGVRELATTPALKLALGLAFASPLIEPLRRDLFMVHIAGASRSGKSRAGFLAATVWYDSADYVPYNGTIKGMTLRVEGYNGALLVLDELKEIEAGPLGQLIHTITDGRSRTLAQRTGDAIQQIRHWHLLAISSGEVTMAERLGEDAQGGHGVRAIDVRIERGEATESRQHAQAIDRFRTRHYGLAGDAWVAHLRELDDEGWQDIARRAEDLGESLDAQVEGDPEAGSIVHSLALCAAALEVASLVGVLGSPFGPQDAKDLVTWALSRVKLERGRVTSPETRALQALIEAYEAQPGAFPREAEYRDAKRSSAVVGIAEEAWGASGPVPQSQGVSGRIFTTEGMLKKSGLLARAGVGPRAFLDWCRAEAIGDGGRAFKLGGVKRRWHCLDLTTWNTSET